MTRKLKTSEFLSGITKEEKPIPCLTIVIYFGEEPWDGPKNLKDMLDLETLPPQIRELVADYPVNLLEVRRLPNLEYFRTDIQYVFGLLQNTGSSRGLQQYVEAHREQFENLEEDAYDVISMMSHSKELKLVKNDNRNEKGGINMCKAIQDLITEGVAQGVAQGVENGTLSAVHALMENMNITSEKALSLLNIPKEEWTKYL